MRKLRNPYNFQYVVHERTKAIKLQSSIRKLKSECESINNSHAELKLKHASETTLLTRKVETLSDKNEELLRKANEDNQVLNMLRNQLAEAVKAGSGNATETLNQRTSHLVAEINRKDKTIAKLEESRHIQKMTIENKMSDIADLNCKIIDLKSEIDTLITLKQPNIQIVTTGAILSVILNMVILYILLG